MNSFHITGPTKLYGQVNISGSKNSALAILFTALLSEKPIIIKNVPQLSDIFNSIKILKNLGVKIIFKKNKILFDASIINYYIISSELSKTTRASIWAIGPLLIRCGKAIVSLPGGCQIGERPIDLHLFGLIKLGAKIKQTETFLQGYIKNKLKGCYILLTKISVGATISIMSTAVLATGITTIENAACEPEIIDVANFLNSLGAKIHGAGQKKIVIIGVKKLTGGVYTVCPDRIETGTFLVGAAISKGNITCYNTYPSILTTILKKLTLAGASITTGKNWVTLNMYNKKLKPVNILTSPYPGFPTDMQALFSLLNFTSEGKSIITETIFTKRFYHITELIKMGAKAKIKNNKVICYGVKKLNASNLIATDLRTAATLILAACIAEGTSNIEQVHFIKRGYEKIEDKLTSLGAKIILS